MSKRKAVCSYVQVPNSYSSRSTIEQINPKVMMIPIVSVTVAMLQ